MDQLHCLLRMIISYTNIRVICSFYSKCGLFPQDIFAIHGLYKAEITGVISLTQGMQAGACPQMTLLR